jgi:dienelactone hydrolase
VERASYPGRRGGAVLKRIASALAAVALLAGCAASVPPKPALLPPDVAGTLEFRTADDLTLTGELALPDGSDRVGAVVLLHGCSGLPTRAVTAWQPLLTAWGYATFVVDSFGGRGIRGVCGNALRFTGPERIPDAYGALALLARHPRIDADRVAVMGFSHGGIATLGAATTWARRRYAPAEGPAFRAFLPFYPYCNAIVPEMADGIAAPVRVHIGELDDWTPARSCESLGALARSLGYDFRVTVYPGARHGFDAIGLRDTIHLRNVDNAAACTPRLASMMGPILNLFELIGCMRKGATVGHDPAATARAHANVRAELSALLAPRRPL